MSSIMTHKDVWGHTYNRIIYKSVAALDRVTGSRLALRQVRGPVEPVTRMAVTTALWGLEITHTTLVCSCSARYGTVGVVAMYVRNRDVEEEIIRP